MKNIILKILTIAFLFSVFTSCNDYLDINTPSEAVYVDDVDMSVMMGPVIQQTVYAHYYAETTFGNYTQYFGGYGYSAAGKAQNTGTWNSIYLRILPNIRVIQDKAAAEGATKYAAVTEILEAISMGLAVDSWNNVPYSQATNPSETVYPEYDPGQQVTTECIALLDKAIAALNGTDNSGFNLGSEDLIYGGDYNMWLKTAYMYKARYQLRLLNKGLATTTDVLTSLNNAYTSNADDFELHMSDDEINPWYANSVLTIQTGNYYRAPNDQIISMMNGTSYPFEDGVVTIDPRLPELFIRLEDEDYNQPILDDTPWRGGMSGGSGQSSDGEANNTYYKDGGFLTSDDAPITLATYAEVMFMKAEMLLANGNTPDAYSAYMAGIQANMDKIGVDGTDYMADNVVDLDENDANLELHHIMKEKYIANIHNTETFADMRRHDFSSDVFKDLALRLNETTEDEDMEGKWYVRAIYPISEKNANSEVWQQNEKDPDVPVWWDE